METIEKLGFGDLRIVQSTEGFRFGIDAVLLSDFAAKISPGAERIADLGTGNGIIPAVLCHKIAGCSVTGFDVQQEAIDLALKGRKINGLEDRQTFIKTDVKDITENYPEMIRSFDSVVTNPPYVEAGSGIASSGDSRYIARHETTADLECFIKTASQLLKERGDFFIVQRPSRLADIICCCRKYKLEPKDMRLVSPYPGEAANIVLLHCTLGGGKQLKVLPELPVRYPDGSYTEEIEEIYERNSI